ncbi:MAG: GNAT family N-acetyltransferase [Chlorobiales bacterium]|nr:GNAT family N-acetyltransferase [Chlorobiales bacterium]
MSEKELPEISVRPAEPNDIDDLLDLLKILFSIEIDFTFNDTVQREGLRLMLEDKASRAVMVAEYGGQVIGMATVQSHISTASGAAVGIIEDVVVKQSFRGRGVGKKLLDEIEAWAKQHGMKRVQLLADRTNDPALKFYDSLQWTPTRLVCLMKYF